MNKQNSSCYSRINERCLNETTHQTSWYSRINERCLNETTHQTTFHPAKCKTMQSTQDPYVSTRKPETLIFLQKWNLRSRFIVVTKLVITKAISLNKGNNKITEPRTILQRESQNSYLYKHTKSVNNRKTVKTVMTLTWYRHF